MIVLNINGIEMTLRVSANHNYATATKRAVLISALEQMPDAFVNKIWERSLRDDPQLILLPKAEKSDRMSIPVTLFLDLMGVYSYNEIIKRAQLGHKRKRYDYVLQKLRQCN